MRNGRYTLSRTGTRRTVSLHEHSGREAAERKDEGKIFFPVYGKTGDRRLRAGHEGGLLAQQKCHGEGQYRERRVKC